MAQVAGSAAIFGVTGGRTARVRGAAVVAVAESSSAVAAAKLKIEN